VNPFSATTFLHSLRTILHRIADMVESTLSKMSLSMSGCEKMGWSVQSTGGGIVEVGGAAPPRRVRVRMLLLRMVWLVDLCWDCGF
jgi:hypothetical protein